MLNYLTPGDIIISTPYINKGLVFDKAVILIISHDKNGTAGIILNKFLNNLNGNEILKSLQTNITQEKMAINESTINLPVYFGGPIEQEKGIILHSNDYKSIPSIKIASDIIISSNSKIIADIVSNNGPIHKALVLGYASWNAGQLMEEIKRNDWLLLPDQKTNKTSTAAFKLLFLEDHLYRWQYALKLAGVSLTNYASNAGHA